MTESQVQTWTAGWKAGYASGIETTRYETHTWNPGDDEDVCIVCGITWGECEDVCRDCRA